jgi:hypothetical protein
MRLGVVVSPTEVHFGVKRPSENFEKELDVVDDRETATTDMLQVLPDCSDLEVKECARTIFENSVRYKVTIKGCFNGESTRRSGVIKILAPGMEEICTIPYIAIVRETARVLPAKLVLDSGALGNSSR